MTRCQHRWAKVTSLDPGRLVTAECSCGTKWLGPPGPWKSNRGRWYQPPKWVTDAIKLYEIEQKMRKGKP